MNSVQLFGKAKLAWNVLKSRCFMIPVIVRSHHHIRPRYTCNSPFFELLKNISKCSSMQTRDSYSNSDKTPDEYMQKVLEDEDFQNILKDFAKDFEVDSEADEVLDDIRKNLEDEPEEKNISYDGHCTNKNSSLINSNKDVQKYKEFSDADSAVIYSHEEKYKNFDEPTYHIDHEIKPTSEFLYNDLKRGITGVFDIDELIGVLHSENLHDITTISIPREFNYADFIVLATAKSGRHCEAAAEIIMKLYKKKKSKMDPFIKVEGDKVANWKAMDMCNIVLHIFLEETRALYDIESLWLFDANYDTGGSMKQDPVLKILEEQIEFFNSMQQSSANTEMPKHTS